MCIVDITEKAESDLDSISDYLAITLANPPAANALLDEIADAIDHIEDDPEIYPLCLDSRLADLGYRKAVVKSYIMIYDVDSMARLRMCCDSSMVRKITLASFRVAAWVW